MSGKFSHISKILFRISSRSEFDRHLGTAAVDALVQFQSDTIINYQSLDFVT